MERGLGRLSIREHDRIGDPSIKTENDFVFGLLFGEQESRESLMSLLNAILRQDGIDPIVELRVIENKRLKKRIPDEKTGSLDIRAELASGEQINGEMQVANAKNMVKRRRS